MKKVLSIVLSLAIVFSAFCAAGLQRLYADGTRSSDSWNLTVTETDIKCTSVYNRSGYGVVSFNGPLEEGDDYADWPWYGLVDKNGRYVIPAKPMVNDPRYNTFDNTFFISDGMICDIKKGYYNTDGSEAFSIDMFDHTITNEDIDGDGWEIEETYYLNEAVFPFYNGHALVQISANASYSGYGQGGSISVVSPVCVIDTDGQVLKEIKDWNIRYYAGEGLVLDISGGVYKYRDYDGNIVIDLSGRNYVSFGGVGAFFDGYAWVRSGESNLIGFIDRTGAEVIPCEYSDSGYFIDGLVNVKKDGKWGYVNAKNEVVIPFEYDAAFGAGNGLAVVGNGGKYGLVDYNNNVVLPLEWDDLSSFEGETAYGIKDGILYVINPAGESGWKQENGSWYYYSDGVKQTGWQKIEGVWYYFSADGAMQTGWQKINGVWYYLNSAMQTGWQQIDGKWYYFSSGGAMQTGWQQVDGKWYYFSSGGAMQTGWQQIDGKWYYLNSAMQTGWQQIDGKWYYLNSAMQTGWQKINGVWYYFDSAMQTGWKTINGKTYFFKSNGAMAASEWCGGWWLNADGTWTYQYKATWRQSADGRWWYGDTSGWYAKSTTITIDGNAYTFDAAGYWVK